MSESLTYQIRIQGHLDATWSNWFSPLIIVNEADGEAVLSGAIRDQAELRGLLDRVFDLNLTLLSVNQIDLSEQIHQQAAIQSNVPCTKGKE